MERNSIPSLSDWRCCLTVPVVPQLACSLDRSCSHYATAAGTGKVGGGKSMVKTTTAVLLDHALHKAKPGVGFLKIETAVQVRAPFMI